MAGTHGPAGDDVRTQIPTTGWRCTMIHDQGPLPRKPMLYFASNSSGYVEHGGVSSTCRRPRLNRPPVGRVDVRTARRIRDGRTGSGNRLKGPDSRGTGLECGTARAACVVLRSMAPLAVKPSGLLRQPLPVCPARVRHKGCAMSDLQWLCR